MKDEEIIQKVSKNQVTIVNSYTYGRIPTQLARDYKVIVATADDFIHTKYRSAMKKVNDTVYVDSYANRLNKQYQIAFIAYGISLIWEIWKNRNNDNMVLLIDDSINCINADLLMAFVKKLLTEKAKFKVIIINKVEKFNKKISLFFDNAPIIDLMPRVFCQYENIASEELEKVTIRFSKHLLYQNILVILPGEPEIENFKKLLFDKFRYPIYTISSNSPECNFLNSSEKKIVLSTGSITSLINFKFDVVIDTGLEKTKKIFDGLQLLTTQHSSKNVLKQRMQMGKKYCLCSDIDFSSRKEVDVVIKTGLDKMILSMISLNINFESLSLLYVKSRYVVNTYLHSLLLIGAIDEKSTITNLGNQILEVPLPMGFSKMFIEATQDLKGDIIILYYVCFHHHSKKRSASAIDLKSDLFGQWQQLKSLFLQEKSVFISRFAKCYSLFKTFGVEPIDIPTTTAIKRMKKLIAAAFPEHLFILTSKTGYQCCSNSKFSYTTSSHSSLIRGENKFIVSPFAIMKRHTLNNFGVKENRGIICHSTVYTLEEVMEYFAPFLEKTSDTIRYNGLEVN